MAVKAFPSVVGGGYNTTGGRGGAIVRVTNLNDSGSGSLREALKSTFPRIIVFTVSGRIELSSTIELSEAMGSFTVAGQSAPIGGITISGAPISVGGGNEYSPQPCNNMIWRYIRFRNGFYNGQPDVWQANGFTSSGTTGLVFDHCSFSFCNDQAISIRGDYGPLTNITVQKCTFSENATTIVSGAHGTVNINDQGNMTFIYNLYATSPHRTPNATGNLQWDIINNIHFNYANRLVNLGELNPNVNLIGNYYKPTGWSADRVNVVQSPAVPLIYTANNYHPDLYPVPQLDDRGLWTDFTVYNQPLPSNMFTTTQFPLVGQGYNIMTPFEAYDYVLSDVGANKYLNEDGTFGIYQDSYDINRINQVIINDGSDDPFNKTWVQPILPLNTRSGSYDTNNDGIPDVWTAANMPSGAIHSDLAPSGYTWIEEYINQVDIQFTNVLYELTQQQRDNSESLINKLIKRNFI